MFPAVQFPFIGLRVTSYSLVSTIYVLAALSVTKRLNAKQGIDYRTTRVLFALGVPTGMIGARVLDVLEYWGRYQSVGGFFGRQGSSIYGAFLFVIPILWLYARSQGVSSLRFLDAGAPAMALGEAMTRVGCFLNGCCYGVPWSGPLAIVFPPESFAYRDQIARGLLPPGALHSLPVVPVQLLSAGLAFLAFAGLLWFIQRHHREGAVFYAFLVLYGALRLGMAPLRQEALASMVVFSVGFIAVGTLGLLLGRRELPGPAKPTRRLSPAR